MRVLSRLLLIVALLASIGFTARPAEAEDFFGIDFPQGASSFADLVSAYSPVEVVPGYPTNTDPTAALGAPDDNDASLGNGGSIVVQFTDNSLTGSGDGAADLHIFESGDETEETFVEVSADGVTFTPVGKATGGTSSLDIDAYGFGPSSKLFFVRVTDDPDAQFQDGEDDRAGPDIDAVGAISSADPTPEPTPEPVLDVEVNVHVRECPAGATMVYEECHPYGIPGVALDLVYADDPSILASDVTNEDGDATFYGFAGGWLLYVTIDESYSLVGAYCSYEENIGTETFIDLSEPLMVESGDVVYCDIYFTSGAKKIDDGGADDGKKDDGGKSHDDGKKDGGGETKLPDTGVGSADLAGGLGYGMIAILAVVGLAFVSRRRTA